MQYFLEFLLLFGVLPAAVAAAVLLPIWRKFSVSWPLRTGVLCCLIGFLPMLFVMIVFRIGPIPTDFGILVTLPTYGSAALGLVLLLLGLARGLRGKTPHIRKLLSDVRHDRHP